MESLLSLRLEQQNAPRPSLLHVCITNAASQVAYHLSSMVATGRVFGTDTPVQLQLLGSSDVQPCLEGVAMELMDLASPCLAGVLVTSSAKEAFSSVSAAFVLDFPRMAADDNEGEETPEGATEGGEGEATPEGNETSGAVLSPASLLYHRYATIMDFAAHKDVRVVISGQLANTGAAVMARAVASLPKENFVASSSLAEQQARSILAQRLSLNGDNVHQVAIWGRTEGEDVIADVSHAQVQHFQGAIVGPDPFSIPLNKCVFDREWLGVEFPRLLAARHGRREGYRRESWCRGVDLPEAVGLARLMADWHRGGDRR